MDNKHSQFHSQKLKNNHTKKKKKKKFHCEKLLVPKT